MSSPLPSTSVTVQVPGTTSNLGSGFDTLGLAVRLYNQVTVTRRPGRDRTITLASPIPDDARAGATAMVAESARAFFRRARKPAFGFDLAVAGDVPVARGLGSSTTVQLGCIVALNELTGAGLDRTALFSLVNELEGHPDNAAPATFGGFTVAGMAGGTPRVLRFAVPARARFVTLVPDFEVRTSEARRLLPETYSRADLVHSLSRVGLVSAALASGDLESLAGLFDDRVHQPYREPLIPGLSAAIRAGVRAGAIGGWLSGSGSTLMCLTVADPEKVGRAMQRVIPDGKVLILPADPGGYRVVRRR